MLVRAIAQKKYVAGKKSPLFISCLLTSCWDFLKKKEDPTFNRPFRFIWNSMYNNEHILYSLKNYCALSALTKRRQALTPSKNFIIPRVRSRWFKCVICCSSNLSAPKIYESILYIPKMETVVSFTYKYTT